MASKRSVKLKKSQAIWLAVVILCGVIGAIVFGWVWGLVAAGVALAASEVTERVARRRSS